MTQSLIRLSGPDTHDFLQGLVTNDVKRVADGAVYAALLTPQGKYIADFFMIAHGDDILLDVDSALQPTLTQRLTMYKLRADVAISEVSAFLHRGLGDAPGDGWVDPRTPALGWRAWRDTEQTDDTVDWDAIYVEHMVPQTGRELTPDSFILEYNFEAINGVDFRKGCYVGQEVTARMKHKTELRKGLARVTVDGSTQQSTDILVGTKVAGQLLTRSGNTALAYLRFDRVQEDMSCGDAKVSRLL